jgi:hypothetical protein
MRPAALLLAVAACGPPPAPDQTVDYREDVVDGPSSGERGTMKISEILWSGSLTGDTWDRTDVFVELRNEGNRPINISGWELQIRGALQRTFVIPDTDQKLQVGDQVFIAAKTDGCFPDADLVISGLQFPLDAPFALTLVDADERLMETAGDRDVPPFAGGFDLVTSRSMERVPLMFGSDANRSQSWKYYQAVACPGQDGTGLNCFIDGLGRATANNDRMRPECRRHTHASPGRANSPDYTGAFANGSFE